MRSSRLSSRSACSRDGLGQLGLLDLRAVLVDHGAVVLAELLADRLHLLAQEVLALLLLRAGLDVVLDAAAHLQLREPLALEADRQLEPLDDVQRLQQLDALLEGQVGRVGAGVGERAGLGDRAQELADRAVRAPQLEDLLDDRAVLGLQLARLDGRRRLVGPLLDLDEQAAVALRLGGAEQRAASGR